MDDFFNWRKELNSIVKGVEIQKIGTPITMVKPVLPSLGIMKEIYNMQHRNAEIIQKTRYIYHENTNISSSARWAVGWVNNATPPIINAINNINSFHAELEKASRMAASVVELRKIVELPSLKFANLAAQFNRQNPAQFAEIVDRFSMQPISTKNIAGDYKYNEESNDGTFQLKKSVRNVLSNEYVQRGFLLIMYIGVVSVGAGFDVQETLSSLGESFLAGKISSKFDSKKEEVDKSSK